MQNVDAPPKRRVLIAEKDGIVAADLQAMFQNWGYDRPAVARTLDELFDDRGGMPFDMVIIDENCQMCSNWLHTIKRIFSEYKAIVVFLSDFFNTHLPENLMAEKSFYLLPKPFNQHELECIASSAARENPPWH